MSLVFPQVSKSFMNPSTNSSTHFRFWCLDKSCLVDAIWRSSSMEAYRSSSPNRPLQIDLEVEGDEFSNGFNLLSCSSILRVVGWDLEGKLRGRRHQALVSMNAGWQRRNSRRECPCLPKKLRKEARVLLNFFGSNCTKKDGRRESWRQRRDRNRILKRGGHVHCRTLNLYIENKWIEEEDKAFKDPSCDRTVQKEIKSPHAFMAQR